MTERVRTCGCGRRAVLAAGIGLAPWLVASARAEDAEDAAAIPPVPGDRFVFLAGDRKGRVIKADDLPLGGPQVQAYPADPNSGVVRDGSRLNLVVLARFDPAALSEETRARAAEGIVAYSGVCTHQGCPVNMWTSEMGALFCSCHGSVYDPKNGAEVLAGPAPRALPSLALKIVDGAPAVAAGFSGHIGPQQH